VYVNVAGGGRVTEPAADLGIVVAAASSYMDRVVAPDVLVVGEVGLTGEVRAVAGLELRLREAAALGFRRAIVPQRNVLEPSKVSLDVRGVATVGDALTALLG
jgi:DNA repair protein RadA/Sms